LVGTAPETVLRYPPDRYHRLSWYGNSFVQLPQLLGFGLVFIVGSFSLPVGLLIRRFGSLAQRSVRPIHGVRLGAWSTCVLNLVVLVGLTILVQAVGNQIQPDCPTLLRFLPLLGAVSAVVSLLVVGFIVRVWRSGYWTRSMWWWACIGVGGLGFVPFLLYWN